MLNLKYNLCYSFFKKLKNKLCKSNNFSSTAGAPQMNLEYLEVKHPKGIIYPREFSVGHQTSKISK